MVSVILQSFYHADKNINTCSSVNVSEQSELVIWYYENGVKRHDWTLPVIGWELGSI